MDTTDGLTRRSFLHGTIAAGASLAALGRGATPARAAHHEGIKVGGFTKEYRTLSYDEVADAVVEIGWDGVECGVRSEPTGLVLPERVKDDLPRMVDALKKRDKELLVMATNVLNPDQKYTEDVLRTGSAEGIKYYRIGYFNYDYDKSVKQNLDEIKPQMRDLEAMNRELGICGIFQNHSGGHAVGAPVWDIYELVKDLDPEYLAVDFDIGHATVEGGYAWRAHFNRIKDHLRGVVVKDFKWVYDEEEGEYNASWCPIGEGMIRREFIGMLKATGFSGPVIMHHEYHVEGEGSARIENLKKAMKADTDTLREWLKD